MPTAPHRAHRTAAAALALALSAATPAAAQPAPPPGLDAYVRRVQEAFEVPGIAVAIVKDGQVVLTRGYGIADQARPAPVDSTTLFGIASNTKAFTATALALLVEEGKLEWDAPVRRYLPAFAMADPFVTAELTVRDLLLHRSGLSLGAGDLLWWPASDFTRAEIVSRVRHVPLSTSFRSAYAYDNVLYVVAGALVEEVSGKTWEEFVRERILHPLGMADTQTDVARALASPRAALPHARVEGTVRRVQPYDAQNGAPAAGLYASARDMARWMVVQLDSGRVPGAEPLFTPATTRQLWRVGIPIAVSTPAPELAAARMTTNGAALGFFVQDYRGRQVVTHTGGLPGYLSQVVMVPELRLGIAVLTNQESGAAFRAISYRVMDHYLGAPRTDWVQAYQRVGARGDSALAAADARTAAARHAGTAPSLPLADYAGTYRDPWYGDVVVAEEDGRLVMRFTRTPWLSGPLEHWHHDTFVARWASPEVRADAFVTFQLGHDARVERVRMAPASPRVDFSFDFQDLALVPVR